MNKSQSHLERKRIRLVNYMAAIGLLLQPFFLIMDFMHKSGLIVNLFFIFIFGIVLIFQKLDHYNVARWTIISGTALAFSIVNVLYGDMIPADAGYILCIALVLILFTHTKAKILGFVALFTLYLTTSYLLSDYQNLFREDLLVSA